MAEYFVIGMRVGAAIVGALVSLALAGFAGCFVGWVIGTILTLTDRDDEREV